MDVFSIAFICTGNRFRSVLAEAFVRRLTAELPVTIESFGTLDLGGAAPLREAVELAGACGLDVSGHVTRCVSTASLAPVDLVVGFEAAHVRQAVVDAGAERDRAFTMREVVRLLEDDALSRPQDDVATGAREAVRAAAALRAATGTGHRAGDETPDPLGASARVYRDTAAEVRDLSLRLARALFGVDETASLPEIPPKSPRRVLLWRR
jgi:protein-tyrosine-phosphatase